MKKTLLTVLGILGFSALAFSQANPDSINKENKRYILNKISKERKFNMNENDNYCVGFKAYKDKDCIIGSYDLDWNGKVDLKARFRVSENGYQNALIVFVDENEDAIPEEIYISTNKKSVGILNNPMSYDDYLRYLNFTKGKDIVMLKPLKPIQPKL